MKPIVYISNTWVNKQKIDGNWERVMDEQAIDLADKLRDSGFDARIDWYFMNSLHGFNPPEVVEGDPRNPYTIWQEEQIRNADCVLLLCIPEYLQSDPDKGACPGRWCTWHNTDDNEKLEIEKKLKLARLKKEAELEFGDTYYGILRIPGLWYDWHFIKLELELGISLPRKFIPVGFGPYNPDNVPMFIQGASYCNLDSATMYEGLTRRIRSIHRQRNPRRGVFVSYAHNDENIWLESLLQYLKPLKEHKIEVWTDQEIKPGDLWHDEIQNSLEKAQVAILMVTPDFLASSYITNNELPPLLKAAKSEGLIIFWIPVKQSSYESTEISQYQAAHTPTKPLSTLHTEELNEAFVAITAKLMNALGI